VTTTKSDTGLFSPVVPEDRWHPDFRALREESPREPARRSMEGVFARMGDRDGNFREQFQTTGFDSRVWELYLYAALEDVGLEIRQPNPAPDFLVRRGSLTFGIEATTANLRTGESKPVISNKRELLEFLTQELPIRLGSPLFSKLQTNYTAKPELRGVPFVLALECFVSPDSMFVSESPLGSYLYGLHSSPEFDHDKKLRIRNTTIGEHRSGEKVIPSGFFAQPGAEEISAILFSNSGTAGKFSRMGYQAGIAQDRIWMGRYGMVANNNPDAAAPSFFAEEVGNRTERWSEGLVVFHNPQAARPLPDEAFGYAAVQYALVDGEIRHTISPFHVFSSQTLTIPAPEGYGVEVARFIGIRRLRELAEGMEATYGAKSSD